MSSSNMPRSRSLARSLDLLDLNPHSYDFGTGPSSNPSPLSTLTSPMPPGQENNPRAFSPIKERIPSNHFPRRQRRWSTTSATMNVSQIYNESFDEVMNNNNNNNNNNNEYNEPFGDTKPNEQDLNIADYIYESDKESNIER